MIEKSPRGSQLPMPDHPHSERYELEGVIGEAMGRGHTGLEIWAAVSPILADELQHGTRKGKKEAKSLTRVVAGLIVAENNAVFGKTETITLKQLKRVSASSKVNRYLK
jgi:hypothetical protein